MPRLDASQEVVGCQIIARRAVTRGGPGFAGVFAGDPSGAQVALRFDPVPLSCRDGRAAGQLWDNPAKQTWDLGQTQLDRWQLSANSGELDLYLFLGPTAEGICARQLCLSHVYRANRTIMKQAVVLIHGIGEQKPMSTLRGFVDSVVGSPGAGNDPYWSKPDPMSELFELRRLQSRGRNSTHFYEYYWAYNVEGTTVWHVILWMWGLVRRPGRDVPASAKSLWLLIRLLLLVVLLLIFTGTLAQWYSSLSQHKVLSTSWLVAAGVSATVFSILVYYLGDVARYCSPAPHNIKLRQTIRAEGLKLLRTLHERGEYDRIIVVGHSLGSIIGYDLVTRLWHEYNEQLPGLNEPAVQKAVRDGFSGNGDPVQQVLRDEISEAGEALSGDKDGHALKSFQETQKALRQELRNLGNPWRISDFITLGSPLAHAMLLMAESAKDFGLRKYQRELPTCPPQTDEKGYAYSGGAVEVGEGKRFTPLLLHHGAVFAVTRWTNFYFPAVGGLFGDIVGGPLRPEFGEGIRDVEVFTRSLGRLSNRSLLAHTRYWEAADAAPAEENERGKPSLSVLRELLGFGARGAKPPIDRGERELATNDPNSKGTAPAS